MTLAAVTLTVTFESGVEHHAAVGEVIAVVGVVGVEAALVGADVEGAVLVRAVGGEAEVVEGDQLEVVRGEGLRDGLAGVAGAVVHALAGGVGAEGAAPLFVADVACGANI